MKINTHLNNLNHYKIKLTVEQAIHQYLQLHGYLNIDLPVMSPELIPEGYLEVFETEFRYMDKKEKLYLTPSPELFLKRLLVAGVGDCYYLGKSFRNSEPNSSKHYPEFTMLEFYKVGATYLDIADEVLNMLRTIAKRVYGKTDSITYQGKKISLEKWEKMTISQAFKKYSDISEEALFDHDKFALRAKEKGFTTEGFNYEDLFSQIYTQEIEPHLGTKGYPTLLYDYPREFASLAKPNPDGKTAARFEFYIAGIELGNCYGELTDWQEQELRFQNEQKLREKYGKIEHPIDTGFIEALKKGLPECSGIAVGTERLAMIFANVTDLESLKLISID